MLARAASSRVSTRLKPSEVTASRPARRGPSLARKDRRRSSRAGSRRRREARRTTRRARRRHARVYRPAPFLEGVRRVRKADRRHAIAESSQVEDRRPRQAAADDAGLGGDARRDENAERGDAPAQRRKVEQARHEGRAERGERQATVSMPPSSAKTRPSETAAIALAAMAPRPSLSGAAARRARNALRNSAAAPAKPSPVRQAKSASSKRPRASRNADRRSREKPAE